MNRFFESLAEDWVEAARRRGVEIAGPALDSRVALELLELARVAAHTQERRYAPLASFMAGVAAERVRQAGGSASPEAVVALLREVRSALEPPE